MSNNFVIISFVTGEPYLSESYNLRWLCGTYNIKFVLYDSDWIKKTDFYKDNINLFSKKKFGYCAWKPYIILDALKTYDKVLYLDSSMLFDARYIFDYINKHDIVCVKTPLKNINYTQPATFRIMNCKNERYYNCNQVWAGGILVHKKWSHIISEWLSYCKNEECVGDTDSSDYLRYRLYDQSILSILFEKYNLPRHDNDMFFDTREKQHRDTIKYYFGESIIQRQDGLNQMYADVYTNNSSCM